MAKTGFLSKQRAQIESRLEELRPLYEEYLTLERLQTALDQVEQPIRRAVSRRGRPPGRGRTRRGPGRPATRGRTTAGRGPARNARRRAPARAGGRGRRGGTRADQTLAVIRQKPGVTIP